MTKTYYMYTNLDAHLLDDVKRNIALFHDKYSNAVRSVADMQKDNNGTTNSWRIFLSYVLPQIYKPVAMVTADDKLIIYQNILTKVHDRKSLQAQLKQKTNLIADDQGHDCKQALCDVLASHPDDTVKPSPSFRGNAMCYQSIPLQLQAIIPSININEYVITTKDIYHFVTKELWPRLQRLPISWPTNIREVTAMTDQLVPTFRAPVAVIVPHTRPLIFALSADVLDNVLGSLENKENVRVERWVRGYKTVDGDDVVDQIISNGHYKNNTLTPGVPLPPSLANLQRYCVLTTVQLQDANNKVTDLPIAVDMVPKIVRPIINKQHKLLNVMQFTKRGNTFDAEEVMLPDDEAAITIYPVANNGAVKGLGTDRPTTVTGSYHFKDTDNNGDKHDK